jgi:mannose-6-phosphate isomerase-like protein (cupin superfamily)
MKNMPVLQAPVPVLQIASEGEVIEFGGFRAVFKSPVGDQREGWMAAEYTLPPDTVGAPLHYHRDLTESFYVISGELSMRVAEQEVTAGPGSFALIPPGTPHGFANMSDAPVRFLAHASDGAHKQFMLQLLKMIQTAEVWPPKDPAAMLRMGERFDTYYL